MREHGRNAIWVASDLLQGGDKEKSVTTAGRNPGAASKGCGRPSIA